MGSRKRARTGAGDGILSAPFAADDLSAQALDIVSEAKLPTPPHVHDHGHVGDVLHPAAALSRSRRRYLRVQLKRSTTIIDYVPMTFDAKECQPQQRALTSRNLRRPSRGSRFHSTSAKPV